MAESENTVTPSNRIYTVIAIILISLGLILRLVYMCSTMLWVDEAESSINALTIQQDVVPVSEYMGLPIYENTLTELNPDSEEYEFRDSSYSKQGVAIYHGWLPLYAIAAAQFIAGIGPDHQEEVPQVLHGNDDIFYRTIIPRVPSLIFSMAYLIILYQLLRSTSGYLAAISALTWAALSGNFIRLGTNARYYSLTLLMSVVCAATAWRLYKHGRWRDYLLLGFLEGLFFHTHQLSAVIFALTCFLLAPRIMQHERWFLKCAAAVMISSVMTIPWAILSGFFTTASEVPKAYELFYSWKDWLVYFTNRQSATTIFSALVVALFGAITLRWLMKLLEIKTSTHLRIYLFLLCWIATAIVCFHVLVPAASFFFERLTLIILTPVALFLGMSFAELGTRINRGVAISMAVLWPMVIIHFTSQKPQVFPNDNVLKFESSEVTQIFAQEVSKDAKARIYSVPNDHLFWTYYTGLPVQSVAPVRRSFFENYPHTVIFIEYIAVNVNHVFPDLKMATEQAGFDYSEVQLEELEMQIREYLIYQNLRQRKIIDTEPEFIGDSYRAFIDIHRTQILENHNEWKRTTIAKNRRNFMIMRELDVEQIGDLWLGFFYRFSDYESRIGTNMNIRSRQMNAQIHVIPSTRSVIYVSPNNALASNTLIQE